MRTSEEVCQRVRWDPQFDPARFVLGVARRGTGPKRVPLPSFVPGGDIPWHRVLFIEADGEVVWDRAGGFDRLDATAAGRVREPRLLREPFFTAGTPYRWDPATAGWHPAVDQPHPEAQRGTGLRVLTWNTLWDRYDRERIETARRRPLLLAELEQADADVIALQEVDPALLALLLRAPWVRAGYTVDADPGGRQVDDCGLLLLSRLPVSEAGRHRLGRHKAVTAVTVRTAAGPLVVAATHLSSDHSTDGAGRRREELAGIAEGLAGIGGDLLLLGDFNDGRDGDRGPAAVLGLRDAWTEARGAGDRTPTFDPRANPLAAFSSLSGRAGRLDRVLLRTRRLRAAAAGLHGEVPAPDGLFPSDHYGVAVRLDPGPPPAPSPAPAPVVAALAEDPAETGRAAAVGRRIAAALGADDGPGSAAVHLVGSRRMGCALPGADVDLVAALPGTVDPAELRSRLGTALPDAARLRPVTGARVPGLRLRLEGLDVDLALVATGGVTPAEAVSRASELGEAAAIALSAVGDADALGAAVGERRDQFTVLARQVKAWARARGLDSAPFGGLPGLAWCLLAAHTVRTAVDLSPEALLRRFFGDWAAHDWREPVGLAGPAGPRSSAPVTVLTPTAPVRSCTTQVLPGGRELLVHELYRAWELLESAAATDASDPWPELLAPPRLHQWHAGWAVAAVDAEGPEEFDATLGRVRGRMRALLAALEAAGSADARAWPRPIAAGPASAGFAVGLGRTPPSAAVLAGIAADWRRGLPGVTLTPADPDTVPAELS